MARWLVQLSGDRTDLAEFPRWFPDGEVYAIEESGTFFLVGPGFEVLDTVEAVRCEAVRALDRLAAVISLLWPALRKPALSHVFRDTDEAKRDVFLSASISARSKVHAVVANSIAAPQQLPQRTKAQELLKRAIGSPHLDRALSLWADPMRSWSGLYCVLEEIEQHLGKAVDVAGLCPPSQRERFRRTANTAEVSGSSARHATGKFAAPTNPMSLPEAVGFIGQVLLSILR